MSKQSSVIFVLLPAYIAEESYQEISVAESLWDQRLNNNAMQQPADKSVQAAWAALLRISFRFSKYNMYMCNVCQ